MGKIAILDTDVCGEGLHCNTFQQYHVRKSISEGAGMGAVSHGTACSMILDRNTTDYDLISIPVLDNAPGEGGKPWGNIEDLRQGLLLCRELEVDLVCLSVGSTILSDAAAIYDLTCILISGARR